MYLEEWPRSAGDGTKGGDLDLRREKRQTATQGNRGRGRPGKYVGLSPDKARLLHVPKSSPGPLHLLSACHTECAPCPNQNECSFFPNAEKLVHLIALQCHSSHLLHVN